MSSSLRVTITYEDIPDVVLPVNSQTSRVKKKMDFIIFIISGDIFVGHPAYSP